MRPHELRRIKCHVRYRLGRMSEPTKVQFQADAERDEGYIPDQKRQYESLLRALKSLIKLDGLGDR